MAEGLSAGTVLRSTYRIERLIAVGGMGAVYEARHVRLGRRVAVKVLLDEADWTSALVSRLRQEAHIIAQLEHPHIVQVIDVDETDEGIPYLVMEHLEGETLAMRLARTGPLPVTEVLQITSDIAAALAQIHERGVVHCDLKPGNIFLVRIGSEPNFVKVFDFGVSRAANPTEGFPCVIAGTPRYMPPEQRCGSPALDARVDQYALAAVVYEMLSGRAAFEARRSLGTLRDIFRDVPRKLSELAPWVPAEFDAVLSRALSPAPESRFPSVGRFASELMNAAIRAGVDREREWSGQGSHVRRRVVARDAAEAQADTRMDRAKPWHQYVEELSAITHSALTVAF